MTLTVTKKVCTGILIGSFLSWFVWILIETLNGKGFSYNIPGLIFGLVLTLLAFILYVSYFKMNKPTYIYILLATGSIFSITMFLYSYFAVQPNH